jgi:hypothetical protein
MAKFYGNIGFAEQVEVERGIYDEKIVERPYSGDLLRNYYNLQNSNSLSADVSVSHSISIVADPYADANFPSMRYVIFRGTKWKITNVEVQYPRLILTIGGLYNGN